MRPLVGMISLVGMPIATAKQLEKKDARQEPKTPAFGLQEKELLFLWASLSWSHSPRRTEIPDNWCRTCPPGAQMGQSQPVREGKHCLSLPHLDSWFSLGLFVFPFWPRPTPPSVSHVKTLPPSQWSHRERGGVICPSPNSWDIVMVKLVVS